MHDLGMRRLVFLALFPLLLAAPAAADQDQFHVGGWTGVHHEGASFRDGIVLHDEGGYQEPHAFFSAGVDGPITYSERRINPNGWYVDKTPYAGVVVDVADDATGTYVLFGDPHGDLKLAKRTQGGRMLPARTLTTADSVGGALVVRDGKWWVVWEQGDHLWQAGTIGTVGVAPRQVTGQSMVLDSHPDLALWGSGDRTRAVLVWDRGALTGDRDVWLAQAPVDGHWRSGLHSAAGGQNTTPAVAVNDAIYVAWNRDGHLVVTDNKHGTRTEEVSTVKPLDGRAPMLGVTYGTVYAATPGVVRVRRDGTWTTVKATEGITAVTAGFGINTMLVSKSDTSVDEAGVYRLVVVAA
jgi:hypothetical protein